MSGAGEKDVLLVAIADRSGLVCEGVRAAVNGVERTEVIGVADDSGGLARLIAGAARPPVVIAGTRLADMDLADALRSPGFRRAQFRCVVLANAEETSRALRAVEAGAASVCMADEAMTSLPIILAGLRAGVSAVPERFMRWLTSSRTSGLTQRESEILKLLADGSTNFQISARLGLSENTVKYHLKSIFSKLEVGSRAQAVAKYVSGAY